jgi:hypothetical protein
VSNETIEKLIQHFVDEGEDYVYELDFCPVLALVAMRKRIAELEAGLKHIAAQKDVIGWAPAAYTAEAILVKQAPADS